MTDQELIAKVTDYVEANIGGFHEKRLQTVRKKKLHEVLKHKNPYLFKAKHTQTTSELIQGIMMLLFNQPENPAACCGDEWPEPSGSARR